jgi:hypothetical protein
LRILRLIAAIGYQLLHSLSSPVTCPMRANPSAPTAVELEVYKALVSLYNSEESSFWTRNNILMAVQGFLIAATASIVSNVDKAIGAAANPKSGVLFTCALIGLSSVGLLFSVSWLFMVGRAVRIEQILRLQLKTIEGNLNARPGVLSADFLTFTELGRRLDPKFTHPHLPPRRFAKTRLSDVWHALGVGLVIFWCVLLVLFATALGCGYLAASPVTGATWTGGW